MLWILWAYLGTIFFSGRILYFVDDKTNKIIENKIKENPFINLDSLWGDKFYKREFIFFTLVSPIVIPLPLIYIILDLSLYLLILAPFGFKFWNKGYGFSKKANKYSMPWWSASWLVMSEINKDGGKYLPTLKHNEVIKVKNPAKSIAQLEEYFMDKDNATKYTVTRVNDTVKIVRERIWVANLTASGSSVTLDYECLAAISGMSGDHLETIISMVKEAK